MLSIVALGARASLRFAPMGPYGWVGLAGANDYLPEW